MGYRVADDADPQPRFFSHLLPAGRFDRNFGWGLFFHVFATTAVEVELLVSKMLIEGFGEDMLSRIWVREDEEQIRGSSRLQDRVDRGESRIADWSRWFSIVF